MDANVLSRAKEAIERGERAVFVLQARVEGPAPREAGACMLVFPEGRVEGTIGGGALEHRAIQEARALLSEEGCTKLATYELVDLGMLCGGRATLYYEVLTPRVTLAIFGAGHVGSTLARLAREATPFAIALYDDRAERCQGELAPGLSAHHLPEYRDLPEIFGRFYAIVCTDSHATDLAVVQGLLTRDHPPAFLGMLGSKPKAEKVKALLREAGLPEDRVRLLRSPVGLPIGGKSPGEIAVSILSQLLAFHHGRLEAFRGVG